MDMMIRHIDDERLERYSLGTLSGEDSAELEQHLLICGPCQDRLARMDAYLASMEAAARRWRDADQQDRPQSALGAGVAES